MSGLIEFMLNIQLCEEKNNSLIFIKKVREHAYLYSKC